MFTIVTLRLSHVASKARLKSQSQRLMDQLREVFSQESTNLCLEKGCCHLRPQSGVNTSDSRSSSTSGSASNIEPRTLK